MAILKCKMCGGDLEVINGASVVECEYCGTQQTVPSADNEKKLTLFSRANRLRMACEFDKAAGIYESIVADFPEEAEAYWGLVLCKYGIEYVDDPATGKKIPTCHRSSFESVMDDSNLEQALENADVVARKVYREEAKAMEELRKGIIEVSGKEEPYDIFICYKETAEDGQRTIDSVIAQDVYDALTDKGYRVFFSRITLEDKLGQEYEPYIFAALHSAKVMLAFGTDYEYYNAVWVKNEWSRFLQLIAAGEKKTLIPCYKGIDAYDMPKEFARLQAQDMGKVGAIQDLLRGIEKILPRKEEPVRETVVIQQSSENNKVTALLERGSMALEDGEWAKADGFFEEVLNYDAKNAGAYVGKTLAQAKCKTLQAFGDYRLNVCSQENEKKETRTIPEDRQHINRMINKMRVDKYLAGKEINRLYSTFDMSYPVNEPKWKRRYDNELNYWADHKLLVRAEQFAQGELAQELSEVKEKVLSWLKAKMEYAKEADKKMEKDLMSRYEAYLAKTDKKVEQMRIEAESLREAERADIERLAPRREKAAFAQKFFACSPNSSFPMHVGIGTNGCVYASCKDKYRSNVTSWRGITTVSLGEFHALGLTSAKTAVSTGDNQYGQCKVSAWTELTDVKAGGWHSVGLRTDGTVVAIGYNEYGQCNVSAWRDIEKIAAGKNHTVGLKTDGTVVATGLNTNGCCNVKKWHDIVEIFAFNLQTVGLQSDGRVVVASADYDVSSWRNIVDISMGYEYMLGLAANGTVVAARQKQKELSKEACNVQNWRDIVAISAKNCHSAALKADGTVVAVGRDLDNQCDVSRWTDIVAISVGDFCTLGLKSDGTVVCAGKDNRQPYRMLGSWKLFSNFDVCFEESNIGQLKDSQDPEALGKAEEMTQQLTAKWKAQGLCQYCGGELKGFFSKKCVSCGKNKDY